MSDRGIEDDVSEDDFNPEQEQGSDDEGQTQPTATKRSRSRETSEIRRPQQETDGDDEVEEAPAQSVRSGRGKQDPRSTKSRTILTDNSSS